MILLPEIHVWFAIVACINIGLWIFAAILRRLKLSFSFSEVLGFMFIFNVALLITTLVHSNFSSLDLWRSLTLAIVVISNFFALVIRSKQSKRQLKL